MDADDAVIEYEMMRTEFLLNRIHAVRNVARLLGIPGWEYRNTFELRPEIATVHPSLSHLLEEFLFSHARWQRFHDHRHAAGRDSEGLSPAEAEELAGLTTRRQRAQEALEAAQRGVSQAPLGHGSQPGA